MSVINTNIKALIAQNGGVSEICTESVSTWDSARQIIQQCHRPVIRLLLRCHRLVSGAHEPQPPRGQPIHRQVTGRQRLRRHAQRFRHQIAGDHAHTIISLVAVSRNSG